MPFGVGPYGVGPYGLPLAILPGELTAPIHSSRYIDKDGRYIIDAETGEFAPMDDVHQRIYLLLAYNFEMPKLVGKDFDNDLKSRVRTALILLTQPPEPAIRLETMEARWEAGNTYLHVTFYNYQSGLTEDIEV
ncbi:MAG: hypothetical protein KKG95_08180 [Candidatus Omnitrophica bacterium]|nr:hypothetical protein [Candidatus Omnitrophota bacterium]MBU1657388.1 hypothetical protein [Candidatus Omnitrophota bacterium]MBU1785297.1 hypothetical protein [Candidatus Omnitrophota bacterium]